MRQGGVRDSPFQPKSLLAQAQFFDKRAVALNIFLFQIVQDLAALAHQLEQAGTGVEVLLVHLEVPGQAFNARGEQRHLDFRGTRVAFMFGVGVNNRLFLFRIHDHSSSP